MSFGEFIRNKRLEKGYTLRGFSVTVGLSPTFVSQMERDQVDSPSEEKITSIARVLGVDEEKLIFMANRIPKNVKEMLANRPELVSLLRVANKKNSEDLAEMIKNAIK